MAEQATPVTRTPALHTLAALGLGVLLACSGATASVARGRPSEAGARRLSLSLIAGATAAVPGSTLLVAVRQQIAPGWHTYWTNPGDAGQPTQISWTLPPGVTAGPPAWPAPRRFQESTLVTYGYRDQVVTTTAMRIAPSLRPGAVVAIKAHVEALVCRDICSPESADLALNVPVAASSADTRWRPLIEQALASVPEPAPIVAAAALAGGRLTLRFSGSPVRGPIGPDVYFFPAQDSDLESGAVQVVKPDREGFTLSTKPASGLAAPLDHPIRGVLSFGGRAFTVSAGPAAPVSAPDTGGSRRSSNSGPFALAVALGMGLLGGLVLNLMPCVFPILAMKAAALARAAGEGRKAARAHGLAFLAGSVTTFVGLGAVLIGLRAAGQAAGWGFQLQSPVVTASLALLMLAVALNMSGVFEAGLALQRAAGRTPGGEGGLGAFFAGVLAVVVAAPCTAPFMAAATGYALTASPPAAMAVFAMIGVGLALPFVLLSAAPALQARLPRPGPWMEALRKALAFPMYGAAAWLAWVFAQQSGGEGLGLLFAAGVALGFALHLYGDVQRGCAAGVRAPVRLSAAGVSAVGAGLMTFLAATGPAERGRASVSEIEPALKAQPYSAERLAALRAQGRQVFVDFTAAWCVTCKVNERVALSRPEVARAMAESHTAYLVGDWTRRDAAIADALSQQGRAGVPLYLLYRPGAAQPTVLPQLLTPQIVTDALQRRRPA